MHAETSTEIRMCPEQLFAFCFEHASQNFWEGIAAKTKNVQPITEKTQQQTLHGTPLCIEAMPRKTDMHSGSYRIKMLDVEKQDLPINFN